MRRPRAARIGILLVDLDRLERGAEFTAQPLESFLRTHRVLNEPQSQDACALTVYFLVRRLQLLGRCMQSAAPGARDCEGQRRLCQNRRQYRCIQHHCKSKVAGETHADGSNAAAAALGMSLASESPQPVDYRARLVGR